MINLLVLIAAVFVGFRIVGPFLRFVIAVLFKLISTAFLIALVVIVLVGLLSHGMFI